MTDPTRMDPERLAALLDGRLADAEAAEVRAQLAAADDETLAAYADAVAATAMVEGHSSERVRGLEASRRQRRWVMPSLAAAAVLAATVLVVRRGGMNEAETTSARLVATLAPSAAVPPAMEWATRGVGVVASERGRAVRAGALATDLELAAQRHDTAFAGRAAALAALVADVPGGSSLAARLDTVARAPAAADAPSWRALTRQALQLTDSAAADVGAWLEAARSASAAGDRAFFARAPAERALMPLDADPRLDAAQRAALAAVRRRADAPALAELLRQLAR